MKSELTIYKKWKMNIYFFIIIIFIEFIPLLLLNMLMASYNTSNIMRMMIMLVFFTVILIADIYFFYNRIYLFRQLLDKTPVKCTLEDIFLIRYKKDKKVRFEPYPIVRSTIDGKLYLAYRKYSLSDYTAKFNYSDRNSVYCTLYKSDGKPVTFGSYVDMYILRTFNIPVFINERKNTVKLKRRKFYFYHMNDKIDINVFNDIIYFKGAIDLDLGVM